MQIVQFEYQIPLLEWKEASFWGIILMELARHLLERKRLLFSGFGIANVFI